MMDFLGYCSADDLGMDKEFYADMRAVVWNKTMLVYYQRLLHPIRSLFALSHRFSQFATGEELFDLMRPHCSPMMVWGEGWLLISEVVEMITVYGCKNILVLQPWGCLPNHITGKGFLKELREKFPGTNFVAIDFDTSGSEVNQMNRISLMLSVAKEQLKKNQSSSSNAPDHIPKELPNTQHTSTENET